MRASGSISTRGAPGGLALVADAPGGFIAIAKKTARAGATGKGE